MAPSSTYSFYVYAVGGSGNKSSKSNTMSATTPPDTTSPTPPFVSVVGVNPTEDSLEWTASTDDGSYLFYQIFVNGALHGFYHLHQPWGIVGSIVSGALFYAFPTRRSRSTWMGVIVHSGQSVYLAFLILGVVLGLA